MTSRDDEKPAAGWTGKEWIAQGERLFVNGRAQRPEERGIAALVPDSGAFLERELLLADGVADAREAAHPAPARHTGWLICLTLGLVALALGSAWVVRERRTWDEQRSLLEGKLTKLSTESCQRIEGLSKENAQKEQLIAERKLENQNLAGLLGKALGQIEAVQMDLRHERERNEKLVAAHHNALEAARKEPPKSTVAEMLPTWLLRWVRAVQEHEKARGKAE